MLVSTAVVATGILIGSGFVVQSTVTANQVAAEAAASTARTQADVIARVAQSKVDADAQNALTKANAVVDQSAAKVDATPLIASIASLNNYTELDAQTVTALTTQTESQAQTIAAAAAEADRVAAEAAAAAAAKAAADAAAAAEAAAAALAAGNTVSGAKATAESIASSDYGWGASQFSCLVSLWAKESGWSYQAYNASSGATGIPQALPGSKMATIADDWKTNATTQIRWGLAYINSSYGSPCSAWSHSQSVNWY
ncbi:hypothetical protein B7R25_06360 [Subtercola boreus]|uniref:Phospholipase n=1 Tax=Subtercola boreus TaxID=120213 RepID=A0A3E0WEI6_9MICO|nr:hypothetical protein B7R24_06290 [Subtercola boreus]RFA21722.1 hypothetical protein B7R23_06235 [Subtercola boreus]RFA27692.1 hypothetical protein B7R25_06360 [Subtercola boreus]